MKWILGILLAAVTVAFPNDIAKINRLKAQAEKAYMSGDFQGAIEQYGILIDSFQVSEAQVMMNYANAAFLATKKGPSPIEGVEGPANSGPDLSSEQSQQLLKIAQNAYTNLAQDSPDELRSMAFNQLGVMAYQSAPPPKPGKDVLMQAQGLFKAALKTDQYNEKARFNYELVTKMLEQEQEQQEQDQQQQNQDQEQQNEQEQEQQDQDQQQQDQQQQEQQQQEQSGEDQQQEQEGQEENSEQQEGKPEDSEQQQSEEQQGEEQPQEQDLNASPEKMEELKISEEKAKMILEAMKNAEVQYIQQNQKKATKRPDSGKPDW